jgi:Uma2 family endonuclease
MTRGATSPKPFKPGTTGWTASDLDDPRIEGKWLRGRYEIIEGVLARMPLAYFVGGEATQKLVYLLTTHLLADGRPAAFAAKADIVIDETRVLRADMAYMTPEDKARQAAAGRAAGKADPRRTRILVPPTLVIESVSRGHELHDERTKRRWYAEFGVPNYWLLNVFDRTLHCLQHTGADYRDDASGRESDVLQPSAFPGLQLPLASIWPA